MSRPPTTDRRRNRIRTISSAVLCAALAMGAFAGCTSGYVPPESGGDADSATDANGGGAGSDAGETQSGDMGGGEDGGPVADADVSEDGSESNSCTPNSDGMIERDQVPLRAGLQATFRVAEDVEVDTAGTTQGGTRTWDFTGDYPGDSAEIIELQSVEGKWFASDYPEADYAMKLAGDSEELGVFRTTDTELQLLGVVSPEDGATTTNISYDPPVTVLQFPLEKGETWQTETEATGTHETWSPVTPISYDETYTNEVDAEGTVRTPYGTLEDVLRVRTKLERSGSVSTVPFGTIRTFSFVDECFGTIVTIRSNQGESEKEFSEAAELRRFSK